MINTSKILILNFYLLGTGWYTGVIVSLAKRNKNKNKSTSLNKFYLVLIQSKEQSSKLDPATNCKLGGTY